MTHDFPILISTYSVHCCLWKNQRFENLKSKTTKQVIDHILHYTQPIMYDLKMRMKYLIFFKKKSKQKNGIIRT